MRLLIDLRVPEEVTIYQNLEVFWEKSTKTA
jgi:hypothetical protein